MNRFLSLLALFILVVGGAMLFAQAEKGKIYEVTDGITAPRLLEAASPGYTDEAKKKKITGDVIITVIVDEKGDVIQPKVKKGLGYGLDESAIEAAKMFKYKPAEKDGTPVAVRLDLTFPFYPTE